MTEKLTQEERLNRALDAYVFRRLGVSPNSKWAKNYSKMMRQPLTEEEWRAFLEKMKDPEYAAVWMDRALSGWHRKKISPDSRRRPKKQSGH